ncbi:DUF4113 domain-containing protein [Billgrantia azerbaijanica]|nr:DUF4113 domain-containing protein [Halomonas azerbaijanica]
MGRGTVTLGRPSKNATWHLRCAHRMPRCTTRWKDSPIAKA